MVVQGKGYRFYIYLKPRVLFPACAMSAAMTESLQ